MCTPTSELVLDPTCLVFFLLSLQTVIFQSQSQSEVKVTETHAESVEASDWSTES